MRIQAVRATLGDVQVVVAGEEAGTDPDRGHGRHVRHRADLGAATPDAARAPPGAVVAVEGRHADQGGHLLAGASAEIGHVGQQGGGGDRADAGDALQPGRAGLQVRIRLLGGGQVLVQLLDQARYQGQEGVAAGQLLGLQMAALLLLSDAGLDELASAPAEALQLLDRLRGPGTNRRLDVGRKAVQHAGADLVRLGQDAVGAAAGRDRCERQPRYSHAVQRRDEFHSASPAVRAPHSAPSAQE